VPDRGVTGALHWRRYPSSDAFRVDPLARDGDVLKGRLHRQPPGGKLEYHARLARPPELVVAPATPAVSRFKDPRHPLALVPHILAMFLGMLWSMRAGLAAVTGEPT
jgi:hypothetical protein